MYLQRLNEITTNQSRKKLFRIIQNSLQKQDLNWLMRFLEKLIVIASREIEDESFI